MGTSVMGRIGLGGGLLRCGGTGFITTPFLLLLLSFLVIFFKQKACPELKGEFHDKLACDCLI